MLPPRPNPPRTTSPPQATTKSQHTPSAASALAAKTFLRSLAVFNGSLSNPPCQIYPPHHLFLTDT